MESKRATNSVPESEAHQSHENDASGMTGNDPVDWSPDHVQCETRDGCDAGLLPDAKTNTSKERGTCETQQPIIHLPIASKINKCKDRHQGRKKHRHPKGFIDRCEGVL